MADAELTYSRVRDTAIREATGEGWAGWLEELDEAGAGAWDHRTTVAHLEATHAELSGWWHQTITVGYEQARGKREVGQTATAGYELGVQRSTDLPLDEVWERIVGHPDLWLGDGMRVTFEPGASYEGQEASGEVRVVERGSHLRMTWLPTGWDQPATVQLRVSRAPSGKTTVGAHLEKLPDAEVREAMREHWRAALDRLLADAQ